MKENKVIFRIIIVISIVVPLLVAFLLFFPGKMDFGVWVYQLPKLNALLNSLTSLALIGALLAIRNDNIKLHRMLMTFGFTLGGVFLLSYVIYHSSAVTTVFGDLDGDGILSSSEMRAISISRMVYIAILLSHLALSIIVVPLVLFALFFALTSDFVKHRKIVKYTFPIWLYVSVTGVIVYLMVSPYYLN